MSSEAPPPKPRSIRARRLAQRSDPDARPSVVLALAAPPSAALPPVKASEVRVGSPTHHAVQGSGKDAHPNVAEAVAPPPSASLPPLKASEVELPLLKTKQVKVRIINRAAKGSCPAAEIPAPPPSAGLPPLKASDVRVGSPTPRAAQHVAEAPAPPPSAAHLPSELPPLKPTKIAFVKGSVPAGETSALQPSATPKSPEPRRNPRRGASRHSCHMKFKDDHAAAHQQGSEAPFLPSYSYQTDPTPRAAQDSEADDHVAEAPAPPPSACNLLSELLPLMPSTKLRFVVKGSVRTEETLVLPSSATPKSPGVERIPCCGASMQACNEKFKEAHGNAQQHGSEAPSLPSSSYRSGPHSKSLMLNDIGDASTKAVLSEKVSGMQYGEKHVSSRMLRDPDMGEKKIYQLSTPLQLIVSKLSKSWSLRVDQAVKNFKMNLKEYPSEKPWEEKVDEASSNLADTLKELQNEQSRYLIGELSKELDCSTFGVKKLALIYDDRLLLHRPPNSSFSEKPSRITSIMDYLKNQNLLDRCDIFGCEKVDFVLLSSVHTDSHISDIESISSKDQDGRDHMALKHCGNAEDLYYSEYSGLAAFLAAGGAVKACSLVADREYQYSFAIIRPPGHHAGRAGPTGFCLFNNVAVATSYLLEHYKMKKVMIIDWDYHHGNGTEEIFYEDERVLFFSVHRFGHEIYPHAPIGSVQDHGKGSGAGFNVNVCWEHGGIKDIDYFTVWEHVLVPLIGEFEPEIILISAGFDAAPVVMVLEGGYNVEVISKCAAACVEVLLGDKNAIIRDTDNLPYDTTWKAILEIRKQFRKFWKVFESEISAEVVSKCIYSDKRSSAKGSSRTGRRIGKR